MLIKIYKIIYNIFYIRKVYNLVNVNLFMIAMASINNWNNTLVGATNKLI